MRPIVSIPAGLAKFSVPDAVRAAPRARLFERLDEARRGRVVWITAPPGAGKTTLVASYLKARKLRAIWYQLDAADTDVASFFLYLGLAAKQHAPRAADKLPALTAEYLAGLPAFSRNYFRRFYAIVQRTPIVFDDYHELGADSPVHAAIREGLAEVPAGQCVIVISRAAPPPTLARLCTLEDFTLLTWNELRFKPEECAAMVRMRLPPERFAELSLPELYRRAQGWVAGAILLLEQSGAAPAPAPVVGDPLVFDYFAGEIFDRTDGRMQAFLVRTALLPHFTAELARAVTGMEDAEHLLADVDRQNYFLMKRSGGDAHYVYEYSPLFRNFLLDRGRRMLGAAELAQLKRHAAQQLADHGEIEACAALLVEIEDWQSLVSMLAQHAPRLLREGRYQTLSEWLRAVPEPWRDGNPWLAYFLGVCRLPFDFGEARGLFERAYEGFAREGAVEGEYLAWAGIADTFLYAWSDFKPADRWIEAFDHLRRRHPDFPSRDLETRVIAGTFGLLSFRKPQHPDLPSLAARLEALLLEDIDPVLRMTAANHLMLYHNWWTGRLDKVTELVARLKPFADTREIAPFVRIVWEGILTISYWMTAENEAAAAAAQRGLALAETSGVQLWNSMLLSQASVAAATSGNWEQARALLARMREQVVPGRWLEGLLLHYFSFMEAAQREDAQEMLEHATAALRSCEQAGVVWGEGYTRTILARARYAAGDRDGARAELATARSIASELRCSNQHYSLYEAEAEFAYAEADEPALLESLRRLFAVMREQGFVNSAWWRDATMARWCRIALEHGIETTVVRRLIHLRRLLPDGPAVHLERWPWPIKIYTLGVFRIEIDDKPLHFIGKVQKRPLELLKALIAFGGRVVNESQLAEALWPHADGDAAHNAFVTTLQRLRKLLSHKEALIYQEGRLSLNDRMCWLDAWALETVNAGADPAGLQSGIALYRGAFLAQDLDASWTIPARERLRQRFVRHACDLVRARMAQAQWDEALRCCEQALEHADTAEELYQQLMTCHARLGRSADVLATYRRCRDVLAARLGTGPSTRTEALLREPRA
ncbi:MAG TPA: BTAD domain-containing putative transcriptional regulator [Steroidobacter sp.]|nr:BTAD domain-containing putative transcriptional regulator [Steroidobacter sp.]